ncbi:MAG: YbcC family protein [Cyclobacteriaceae bacterium]
MKTNSSSFNEHEVIHELKHYLPAQAPLKDFIHHNTLHAFQKLSFKDGVRSASEILGYRSSLSLSDFRLQYEDGAIKPEVLDRVIFEKKGEANLAEWRKKALTHQYENNTLPRIGALRANWKKQYRIDLDSLVQPILFRILCSYLDQGISIWNFPIREKTFLASLREMEGNTFTSFFRRPRAKKLLLESTCEIADLLKILVGDELLYERYLFDQQFSHSGWSGMVSTIEDQPYTILDPRKLSMHDLIVFELLLEIDALDFSLAEKWKPLSERLLNRPTELFADVPETEMHEVLFIWQRSFEKSYHDQVLAGLIMQKNAKETIEKKSFQAMFCIDDRECSLRRYLEEFDPNCETFGTPGFFGVEFYYQPEGGKFYTKVCPAPVNPKFLIKGIGADKREKDLYFAKQSHSFYSGWLISQTLGFWSAFLLFLNIFKPSMGPATASSFKHMSKNSQLTIENNNPEDRENDLQIGFAVEEMTNRVEGLLKSIGLVKDFASIVYVVGHGSSSVNNPHYAAYDCGACSGRAGSVNARVISSMANHKVVREKLKERGIDIPEATQFIGGLHDTTRDEIVFFDENSLSKLNLENHNKNEVIFAKSLDYNAKERSRRFVSVQSHLSPSTIHEQIRIRSVSLFEPRPELNHATNALCVVGRRELTKHLFLDRRAFMNSYDYHIDPEGKFLHNILNAVAPVCGGINLEYFFSRVDNQKLGAGTKLPHNVMGLFGVANGIDGDLRPGLPSQMIEVHDPVRLMVIVEHYPDVVLQTIQKKPETYEWFINDWVILVAIHPDTHKLHYFSDGKFTDYDPIIKKIDVALDIKSIVESHLENLPVYALS